MSERTPLNLFSGAWGIVDIETTGLDSSENEIIDIGLICMQGLRIEKVLSETFSINGQLPALIQKLTGIGAEDLEGQPEFQAWFNENRQFFQRPLLAHNFDFEQSFLHLDHSTVWLEGQHSVFFSKDLPLNLKLETAIKKWGLRDHEVHRGLEDAWDLLQVVCLEALAWHQIPSEHFQLVQLLLQNFGENFWYLQFLQIPAKELKSFVETTWPKNSGLTARIISAGHVDTPACAYKTFEGKPDFSSERLTEIYEQEDIFRQTFPHYQMRKSQLSMAQKIGQAFSHQLHTYIQAPTGTGKTLGHLIPSLLFAKSKKEKVLITTGTKALQSQLIEQDLPRVQAIVSPRQQVRVEKLVGTQNHYCELKYRENSFVSEAKGIAEFLFFLNKRFFQKQLGKAVTRENLPRSITRLFPEAEEILESIELGPSQCFHEECPFKANCSFHQNYLNVKQASVIVANHALLFHWPASIKKPKYVIIDEGHRLEEEATQAYTETFSSKDWKLLLGQLENQRPITQLKQESKSIDSAELSNLQNEFKGLHEKLQYQFELVESLIGLGVRQQNYFSEKFWNECSADLFENFWARDRERIFLIIDGWKASITELYDIVETYTKFIEEFVNMVGHWKSVLTSFCEQRIKFACSFAYHCELGLELRVAPIDVGQIIHEKLLKEFDSAVITSATLGDDKGEHGVQGLEWILGMNYLPQDKRFRRGLFLPQVFDLQKQCEVLVVTGGPHFNDEEFIPYFVSAVIAQTRLRNAKTLILCSARSRFEKVMLELLENYQQEFSLFFQNFGPDPVEEFRQSGQKAILLGLESLGEGIDLPGEQLELVAIDKVPDLRMDYVIQRRRQFYQENFGQEFNEYFLGTRARKLKQKFGRLIRGPHDKGTILLFDSRLKKWKPRTRQNFFSLLNPYPVAEVEKLEPGKLL